MATLGATTAGRDRGLDLREVRRIRTERRGTVRGAVERDRREREKPDGPRLSRRRCGVSA